MTNHNTTFGFEIEFLRSASIDQVIGNVRLAGEANDKPAMKNISDQRNRYHTTFYPDRWIQAYDTSCGWEMKSHPLTDTSEVELVMKAIRQAGGSVNRTCGLHVHVDVRHLGWKQHKRLAKIYLRHERSMEMLLPRSRRGRSASYCRANRMALAQRGDENISILSWFAKIDGLTKRSGLVNFLQPSGGRYTKLNLSPWASKGTWEFRGHQGTLNFKKIDAWASVIAAMLNMAQSDAPIPAEMSEFSEMMDELIPFTPAEQETRTYKRPKSGTKTGLVWATADELAACRPDLFEYRADRRVVKSHAAMAATIAMMTNIPLNTVRTSLSYWSVAHNVASRVSSNGAVLRGYLERRAARLNPIESAN